jgi:hypothetical protein
MVCFIERCCQFAKIISMVDERNNGTEHALNGTDGITKVLGEEPGLVSLCPPKFPQELLLTCTRAFAVRCRRLTTRVMVKGGVTLGDTSCLQWFTYQRCQLLIASVRDERNGVWNTDGQKGKIKRKSKN